MFLGQHSQSIDSKGRVVVPAKFRAKFTEGAIVTRGLDNCLYLYTQDEWQKQAGELASQSMTDESTRRSQRILFSGAEEVVPDKVGRISIPEFLRSEVGITDGVIFAGAGNRIEISSSDNWREFLNRNLSDRQP